MGGVILTDHPREVLADVQLTLDEQRTILSSWVSDACAVDSMPTMRRAPFARGPVAFDDIMDALAQLDQCCDELHCKPGRGAPVGTTI